MDCERCNGTGTAAYRDLVPTGYIVSRRPNGTHRHYAEESTEYDFRNVERQCGKCGGTGRAATK